MLCLSSRFRLGGIAAILLLSAYIQASVARAAEATTLRAGGAAAKITPPLGIPLAGYYNARGADGVADDLYAKALVLDDGKTKVALVVCDLISITSDVVDEARKLIAQQTGIPADNVMISATHTHTGPTIPRKSARDTVYGGADKLSTDYVAGLPKLIAKAVADAAAKLAPARASFAHDTENTAAHNRRYWMKDGTVRWNPGKLNPEIARPSGPIDPEVGMVYFETPDKEKKPLATYVNYAIHFDNTGGNKISADMSGHLSRLLAGYFGPDMVTVFANGTCGDINHVNTQSRREQKGIEEATRLATLVAAAVFRATMDLKPAADTTLRVRREVLQLPLAKVSEEDLVQAREIAKNAPKAKFMDQVQAFKALDVAAREGKPWEVEVQVITLGKDLAWVALPGEVFVDLGLSIKAASPFTQTQIAELANSSMGYVPNMSAYPQGQYEVVSTRVGEGGGEMMVKAAIKMLAELHAEAAPEAK